MSWHLITGQSTTLGAFVPVLHGRPSPISAPRWQAIPGGTFTMGDPFGDVTTDTTPLHSVTLSPFDMYSYEVTNGEYRECVAADECSAPQKLETRTDAGDDTWTLFDDYPVRWVDWQQAADFCQWVGGRLPTEAEWEYAARGGFEGRRFPWGNTIDCTQANYITSDDIAYDVDPKVGESYCVSPPGATEVGRYAPNGYGLYDMAGNVAEWVGDWYSATYYTISPLTDPTGPATGSDRVVRGIPAAFPVAYRIRFQPTIFFDFLGFRCAR